MPLTSGTRLGPYEIVAPIGAGGMGEVYKARDTRLDRTVAIKVLPAHTADRPEVRQRFEREARAVSALNHPRICTLYDVGQQGALDFLIMEYIEGETLAERLKRGALPLDQTLRIATEVADALDRAHRTGIVHRDLKPGNIMLTKDGVKVLDFGLAKMRAQGTASAMSGGSVMETLTSPLTGEGSIVGTLQYMSPEQLEGHEADARSDVFAFGTVLYEMATGRKAFEARTQAALIAQIMQSDPPGISSVMAQAPPALEQLARACLAKDPAERRQTMRDVMTDLKWIAASSSKTDASKSAVPPPRALPVWIWKPAAATFAVVTAGLAAALWLRPIPEPHPTRFIIQAPDKSTFGFGMALSPDGTRLAFIATTEGGQDVLWLRAMDSLTAQPLVGSDGARFPFWSPDSRSIAFFSEGKLKRVDAAGGPVLVLCDAPDPRGGAWGADGTILVAPDSGLPLERIPSGGGSPAAVTRLNAARSETSHRWPHFLPDGRHFVFFSYSSKPANNVIALGSLDNPDERILTPGDSAPAYSPPGYLLFARGTNLVAQPFSAAKLRLEGDPFPVAENVYVMGNGTGPTAAIQASVSASGTLAYQAGGAQTEQLAWFDRTGKLLGYLGSPGTVNSPELSPDGKRVAVDGSSDVWVLDAARGVSTRITFAGSGDDYALWSPDGRRIVYAGNRNGTSNLLMKTSTGEGAEEVLFGDEDDKGALDWSKDGRLIVFATYNLKTKWDLWWLPLQGDRKPVSYLRTEFNETNARLSPDGKWLAYASDETGRTEIYVQSFPTPGEGKYPISTHGGDQPFWRADGKELFYLTPDRKLMAVEVRTSPAFESSAPRLLFQTRVPLISITAFRNHYTVAPDGQRFLVTTVPDQQTAAPLVVVLNWTSQRARP